MREQAPAYNLLPSLEALMPVPRHAQVLLVVAWNRVSLKSHSGLTQGFLAKDS
jgi:hypothetical protein